MPETFTIRRIPLTAWFFGVGMLESGMAFVLVYFFHGFDSHFSVYLLPTMVLWGENLDGSLQGPFDNVHAFLLLFGGSFVLYGLIGILLGMIVRFFIGPQSPN